jgi:hypothetical protein
VLIKSRFGFLVHWRFSPELKNGTKLYISKPDMQGIADSMKHLA